MEQLKYPTTTLYQLLCGMNRYMRSVDPCAPNVDRKNPDSKRLHSTMDSVIRSLRVEGIGVQVTLIPSCITDYPITLLVFLILL